MTVLDLIKSSLRLIRVGASGETPSADVAEDALQVFRLMVDEWFNEDLLLYRVENFPITITANKASYTIGEGYGVYQIFGNFRVGKYIYGASSQALGILALKEGGTYIIQNVSGEFIVGETIFEYSDPSTPTYPAVQARLQTVPDWQTHRPDKIDFAFFTLNGVDYPMEVIYNNQYQAIAKKTLPSNLPLYCYLDTDWPNATVFLYPVPSTSGTGKISFRQHFTEYTGLSDVINLPHGYEQALRYNLAIELAPEFGRIPDATVVRRAQDTKANIKGSNMIPLYNRVDRNLIRKTEKYNIYIG